MKIKHNNLSWSHSERWRSQENRSCLSQLLSFSALNYDSYYLLTGFSTLPARSKHSKSSRSLLQRTDRQMREREENLSWSCSNLLLLHVWSERSDVLPTLGWLLPSAEPRLQSCTSAELNCQILMAKVFPAQPSLLEVGFSRRVLVFFLGEPCSLHVHLSAVQKTPRLFHWPCHFETDWFL